MSHSVGTRYSGDAMALRYCKTCRAYHNAQPYTACRRTADRRAERAERAHRGRPGPLTRRDSIVMSLAFGVFAGFLAGKGTNNPSIAGAAFVVTALLTAFVLWLRAD